MNKEREERIKSLENLVIEREAKLIEMESDETTVEIYLEEVDSLKNLKEKIERLKNKAIRGQILT